MLSGLLALLFFMEGHLLCDSGDRNGVDSFNGITWVAAPHQGLTKLMASSASIATATDAVWTTPKTHEVSCGAHHCHCHQMVVPQGSAVLLHQAEQGQLHYRQDKTGTHWCSR